MPLIPDEEDFDSRLPPWVYRDGAGIELPEAQLSEDAGPTQVDPQGLVTSASQPWEPDEDDVAAAGIGRINADQARWEAGRHQQRLKDAKQDTHRFARDKKADERRDRKSGVQAQRAREAVIRGEAPLEINQNIAQRERIQADRFRQAQREQPQGQQEQIAQNEQPQAQVEQVVQVAQRGQPQARREQVAQQERSQTQRESPVQREQATQREPQVAQAWRPPIFDQFQAVNAMAGADDEVNLGDSLATMKAEPTVDMQNVTSLAEASYQNAEVSAEMARYQHNAMSRLRDTEVGFMTKNYV